MTHQVEILQIIHWLLAGNNDTELSNYLYNMVKELNLQDSIYTKSIDRQFIKDCIDGKYMLIKNIYDN